MSSKKKRNKIQLNKFAWHSRLDYCSVREWRHARAKDAGKAAVKELSTKIKLPQFNLNRKAFDRFFQQTSERFLPRCICMQRGLAYRKAVRPSVRPSITRVNCDKTNESSANILIPTKRKFISSFDTKNGWRGRPFYLKFWAKLTPRASKTAISNRYSLAAPQPLDLAKMFTYD